MTELRRSLAGGKCDAWFVITEENCAVKTSARKGDDMKQLNGRQSSRLQKQRHARQSDSDNIIGKWILTGKIELSGTHQHMFSPPTWSLYNLYEGKRAPQYQCLWATRKRNAVGSAPFSVDKSARRDVFQTDTFRNRQRQIDPSARKRARRSPEKSRLAVGKLYLDPRNARCHRGFRTLAYPRMTGTRYPSFTNPRRYNRYHLPPKRQPRLYWYSNEPARQTQENRTSSFLPRGLET